MAWKKFLIFLIPLLGILSLWFSAEVSTAGFQFKVSKVGRVEMFETRSLYLLLHAFTIIPVLLLSFDRRVRFYKSWKYLIPAIAITGALFLIWDVIFSSMRVWGFNETYHFPFTFLKLPIEEWLFFLSVPFACVFIYECLNYYIKKDPLAPFEKRISWSLIILFGIIGLTNLDKLYTSSTFLLTSAFILFHYFTFENTYRSRFYLAYLISWIPFLLVDGVLTGGFTSEPVVLYHPEELLGWRIFSVPIEDSIYSLLLLFGVVTLLENFRKPAS